jgi:hypothetical protein
LALSDPQRKVVRVMLVKDGREEERRMWRKIMSRTIR